MLRQYRALVMYHFDTLGQLANAIRPDGDMAVANSYVSLIEPEVFDVLKMTTLGHKLLFARGVFRLVHDGVV